MPPRNGFLLFLAMHLVVVASLFGFYWFRGHDIGRSITCAGIWGVLSVVLWLIMLRRQRYVAMVGFAVAASAAAAFCQAFYSLGGLMTAPLCMFSVLIAAGASAGAGWNAGRAR